MRFCAVFQIFVLIKFFTNMDFFAYLHSQPNKL